MKSNKPSQQCLVLGCGALVYELVELINHNDLLKDRIKLHCLPAHYHNTPQKIAPEVDKFLAQHADKFEEIFVAYADCGTVGELDKVLDKYQAKRIGGEHCFEFFVGSQDFSDLMEEELGTFFLTDFFVAFFDRIILDGLGLRKYPELKDMYFQHYKRVIYIAQTENLELQQKAKAQAEYLGLDYEYRYVGMGGLDPVLKFSSLGDLGIPVEINTPS